MTFWIPDPSNHNKPSVTLSMFVTAFVLLVTFCCMEALGLIESTSSFMELFMVCSGQYLIRRNKMGDFMLEYMKTSNTNKAAKAAKKEEENA